MSGAAEQPAPSRRPSTGQDDSTPAPHAPPTDTAWIDSAVRAAAGVAVEALEERARTSRLLLTDRTLYGLTDPNTLQRSVARDQDAARVLRAALQRPVT